MLISASANILFGTTSPTHMISGKEIVQESYTCVLQIAGSADNLQQFTTLQPGVSLLWSRIFEDCDFISSEDSTWVRGNARRQA